MKPAPPVTSAERELKKSARLPELLPGMNILKTLLAVLVAALACSSAADYRIKEGDGLTVRYVFGVEGVADLGPAQATLEVPPGGVVSLPYVGEVRAAGQTVGAMQAEVTQRLRKRFPLSECFITLSSIRPAFFSLIGEVKKGGQFPLAPGMTLREGLSLAEGYGRRPELLQATVFRQGRVYKSFDLFGVAAGEDPLGAEPIQPGDVLSIQTRRQLRVWVAGWAKETGEVSIEEGTALKELIARVASVPAGNAAQPAERREQVLVTVVRGGTQVTRESLFDVESGKAAATTLSDGDFVTIAPRESVRVWVLGGVARPGQFDVAVGSTAIQAVAVAGGSKAEATLTDVTLMRAGKSLNLDLSKNSPRSEGKTTTLEAGDILIVGANNRRIAVLGQVNAPGLHTLNDEIEPRISDAIALAGGWTKRGPANRVWIVRTSVDGSVAKLPVDFSKFLFKGDAAFNPRVYPGDVVMVGETPRIEIGDILGVAFGLIGIRNVFK
jgi:protein involved in polysaccharide export with SLBB domain